jgi:dGTPase
LEVSQIARTIARALRLNEDLTEAIALGHDLGHTPFGHAGEKALNEVCSFGFTHSIQSVRVVDELEKDGKGLNLTYEVKDGIRCHTNGQAETLEGRVVKLSDKVAYINHDIEDAIRAGVLKQTDLPYNSLYVLGQTKTQRITSIIHSVIQNSVDDIVMDEKTSEAHFELRNFLFQSLYTNPVAKGEEGKAQDIVKNMFFYFLNSADKLPDFYKEIAKQTTVERAVCDYIAGMSDVYAISVYKELFIPKSWGIY